METNFCKAGENNGYNTVDVNIRMCNDMRFLDWHQHLVLWAKSHVPGLLNSIKYPFLPRRQNQARGRTDAPAIRFTFSRTFLSHVTLQCIVKIVTGNANYVSLSCDPWTSQSGKFAWPEVPVQRGQGWHGPGHSTDEVERIEIWHKPPASLGNKQGLGRAWEHLWHWLRNAGEYSPLDSLNTPF